MSTYNRLYAFRRRLDRLRQPTHGSTDLTQLDTDMTNWAPLQHPYDFPIDQYKAFLKRAESIITNSVSTAPPAARYHSEEPFFLYRLHSAGSFLHHANDVNASFGWLAELAEDSEEGVFTQLESAWLVKRGKNASLDPLLDESWLRLSDVAKGKLSDLCGFTWWTDYLIPPTDVIHAKHQLGLTERNVKGKQFILRCDISKIGDPAHVKVPTSIAGYTNPIFQSALWDKSVTPASGKSIRLSQTSGLGEGQNEYILPPTDVAHIEFRPVQLDSNTSGLSEIADDTSLRRALAHYYRGLF